MSSSRHEHVWGLHAVREVGTGRGTSASVTYRCLRCRKKVFRRTASGLLLDTIRYRAQRGL